MKKHVMPAPPSFLLQTHLDQMQAQPPVPTTHEKPENAPRAVDFTIYQSVVEDRKSAEIRTAEIYSKYLEVVNFSESLIRKLNRMDVYKKRVRDVYNRALIGDQITLDNLKLARRDLQNSQQIVNGMNLDNESLRASLSAHQEAFGQLTKQLGQAEAAMYHANEQFQLLSDDYVKRGEKIQESDKKLNGMASQINELGARARDLQKQVDYLSDENLLHQNQLRESQIQESGLATLNVELTNSIPKLQKQIHLLEEKLRIERAESEKKIVALSEEIDRLRENKLIDAIVERSKNTTTPPPPKPASPSLHQNIEVTNKEQWNEFYSRWSHIIDELSSHSAPIKDKEEEIVPNPQLVSEDGDYDWA